MPTPLPPKLSRRGERPGSDAAGAIFATGAIGALALALSLALEKGWLTVALALMVPGIAWDPRIVGYALGDASVFNWLLYGYGVPALAFWVGGYLLRRNGDDVPARIIDAAAILFTVLLIVFEVRHYLTGDPFATTSPLAETALDVSLLLAVVIGLERLRLKSGSVVHDLGARLLAAAVFLLIVFNTGINNNPMVTGEPVGGRFVNLLLFAYALPALLLAGLAYVTYGTRPARYTGFIAVMALALGLAYLTLQIRRLFHGRC